MQSRRSLLAALATGATVSLAGCSSSSSQNAPESETDISTDSETVSSTPTPSGPDIDAFKSATFAHQSSLSGTGFSDAGQYSPDFPAPDSLKKVFSYGLEIPGSEVHITDGTTYIADETNLRRIEYDGSTTWKAASDLEIKSGPAIDENTVIVSTTDRLIGYDRSSGEEKWLREGGRPLCAEDGALYSYRGDSKFIKSDVNDGSTIWEAKMDETRGDDFSASHFTLYTVAGMTPDYIISVLSSLQDHLIAAYDRSSGEQVWITKEPIPYLGLTVQDGRIIACGAQGMHSNTKILIHVYSLSDGSRQLRFEQNASRFEFNTIRKMGFAATDGEQLFMPGEKKIRAYDLDDGSVTWDTLLPSYAEPAIACSDSDVYAVINGDIARFSAADGTEASRYELSLPKTAGISLVGDHIIHTQRRNGLGETAVTGYAPPQ